jgi:NADH-quinone oxidoreductase subunit N
MGPTDLVALLPILLTTGTALLLMLTIAFHRSHRLTLILTLLGFAVIIVSTLPAAYGAHRHIGILLIIDHYALFNTVLILAASFIVAVFSYPCLKDHKGKIEEYYLLLILAAFGAIVLVSSNHFVSFLLGLEILSISLYVLIAYNRENLPGIEAAMKYLILAGISTAFLLFGMATLYTALGTMEFSAMAAAITFRHPSPLLSLTGLGLIIVGLGFKLAIVPFHFWIPDVYQGAPAPIAAFIATVSKGSIFALLLRYFSDIPFRSSQALLIVFTIISIASMFTGTLLSLFQNNLKRLLAYSSITHMGYLLVALIAGGPWVVTAVTFYLIAYFLTILGAFGVIIAFSAINADAESLTEYQGLAGRSPFLAGILTAMLLSLAGIPLTAGFIGKFAILTAGTAAHLWPLLIALIISSVIGLFAYLRVIFILYEPPVKQPTLPASTGKFPACSILTALALTTLTFCLIWFGTYPSPLLGLIKGIIGDITK